MDRLAVILHVAFCLTVLVAQTCSSSSWARKVLYRQKRQDECLQREMFSCKSGGKCIDDDNVCDGREDCKDGSDETAEQCENIECPPYTFRCSYGGCVEAAARCNGNKDCADNSDEDPDACVTSTSCLLPQHPEFGSYTAPACEHDKTSCRLVPGTSVPQHWLLSFKCNDGYYINGTRDEEVLLYCIDGNWSGKIPVCIKMCSPLISLSVAVKCQYQGDDIDCSKSMRPESRAIGSCKPSYELIRPPPYLDIFCRENGKWSYDLFSCQPVCGKRNVESANTPLIIDGVPTKHGEFPWHIGLYMKNTSNNDWEQQCGGSLISPHIVLTAAHCVFSEEIKKLLSPIDVKVGLGKYYREWTHNDSGAVKSDVREILIPPGYYGEATSYAHDIALLDLTHSVQINTNIMPVCVDWFHQFSITPGTLGMLVGWGETENGSPSDVLLYAELPYIENKQCISTVSQAFQHFVTPDKFCAGSTNGSGAARGDSGGGLTFLQNNLYYVYGIVSTKVHKERSVATFTDVSNTELLTWLNNVKKRFDEVHLET